MKLIKFLNQHNKLIALFAGIVIFRLVYGSYFFYFNQDIARDLVIIDDKITAHTFWVEYGPKASVWNFYLPPFYYQLQLFSALIFGNSPIVMKLLTTTVESFTPLLLFLVLKFYTTTKAAVMVVCIYTISLLVVIFGTSVWNPNMIPFFTTLALYSWLQYLINNKHKYIPVGVLSVSIAVQLHYQAVMVVPFLIYVMVHSLIKRRGHYRYWVLGIALGLLTFSPYVVAEISHNWINTKEIYRYFTLEHTNYYEQISKPAYLFSFIPGFIERVLFNTHYNYWIGRIILWGGLSLLTLRSLKNKKHERWLLLYFLLILIMLRVYKGIKLDYYMSTLFIMPAVLLTFIWEKYQKFTLILLIVILFLMIKNYSHQRPYNQYQELNKHFTVLNEMLVGKSVRMLFHNDDQINTITYGIRYLADFNIDNQSQYILEVCDSSSDSCKWDGINRCYNNRGYTLSSYLKSQLKPGYNETDLRYYKKGVIIPYILTEYTQPIPELNYPQINFNDDYGSDMLIPELFLW